MPLSKSRLLQSLLCSIPSTALLAQSPPPTAAATLPAGLWGGQLQLGISPAHIDLAVQGTSWTARMHTVVGDAARPLPVTATAEMLGDSARFVFPAGTLRLRTSAGSRAPQAFWIQPPGIGVAYASPVHLERAGPGQWTGLVDPLRERFTLFLAVRHDDQGGAWGVFRNPEGNFGGGRTFRVTLDSNGVGLTDSITGRRRFTQDWSPADSSITFDFGAPLVLRPVRAADAAGFVARKSGDLTSYRVPQRTADGWAVADAGTRGFARPALNTLVEAWSTLPSDDRRTPRLHAVLVARRGTLVMEEYFRGWTRDDLNDLRSASKTLTSIMWGALQTERPALTAQDRVTPAGATVANLLTHTSGLACNDEDGDSPGNEDTMQQQREQPDWYAFALALPQQFAPGTHYAYCSAGINLVGKRIRELGARWVPEFFDAKLAAPLGITHYAWSLMPTGEGYAGGGVYLRARDFLKFGELYRRGGRWKDRQLVPAAWVAASTARQQPDTAGADDGYAWHRQTLDIRGTRVPMYEASGNGGQFLAVVPSLDLVVVVTAEHYGERGWMRLREEVVGAIARAIKVPA